jgi:sugar phosphate isomerase/epimerase
MSINNDIRIGTLVPAHQNAPDYIRRILPHGFESFELTFGHRVGEINLGQLADSVRGVLEETGSTAVVSSLGIYGNPLVNEETARDWSRLIDMADRFGCRLVCGFTGRVPGRPVPESFGPLARVFGPLVQQAKDRGVRLAFDNCDMHGTWDTGDWNVAHAPAAWEKIFQELPSDNLGLEWEPCHQLVSLVDPLPQLRRWVGKVFHVHGKDASVLWDVIRTQGIRGGQPYVYHRTPGFGDTNWTDVISILRLGGYHGAIDIEGWHDPIYRGDLEMTGQVRALRYLKECRGGEFVANP